MIPLGFKRKEINGEPATINDTSAKDWDNEEIFPEVYVNGKQAVAMGAEVLKAGEVFTAEVKFKVKELTKTEANGKVSHSLRLCIQEMGDIESETEEDETEDESEAAPSSDTSPLQAAMDAGD